MALIVIGSIFAVFASITIFLVIKGSKCSKNEEKYIGPAFIIGTIALIILGWFLYQLNDCLSCLYGVVGRNMEWGYYSGCTDVRLEK